MKKKLWSYTLAIMCIVLLLTNSCKKEKIEELPVVATPTLLASKQSATPFEIMGLKSTGMTLSQSNYNATINGTSVQLVKANDTLLVFMMPQATGNVALQTNVEGNNFTINFTLQQLQEITDPVGYINTFVSSLNIPIEPQYQQVNDSINFYFQKLNTLSFSEQQQAAYYIEANRSIIDNMNASLNEMNNILNSKSLYDDPSKLENFGNEVHDFAFNTILPMAAVTTATVLLAPVIPFVVGVGIISGTFAYCLYNSVPKIQQAVDAKLNAIEAMFSLNKSYQFNKGTSANIQCLINRENMQDKNYSQVWLNDFIKSVKTINHKWTEEYWSDYLSNIAKPNFSSATTESGYAYNMSNLTLVIMNNNVNGQLGGTVDNLTVTFSTSQTSTQSFQFKITYNDGVFCTSTPVIDASLDAVTIPSEFNVNFNGQSYSLSYNAKYNLNGTALTGGGQIASGLSPVINFQIKNFSGVGSYNFSYTGEVNTSQGTITYYDASSTMYSNLFYDNGQCTYNGTVNITSYNQNRIVGTINAILYYQLDINQAYSFYASFDIPLEN